LAKRVQKFYLREIFSNYKRTQKLPARVDQLILKPKNMPNAFPSFPLFHYASLAEFTAIVENKSLRLFPVDPKELNAALDLIKQVVANQYPELPTDLFNIDAASQSPVYSFSLSSQKDMDSEWSKYCPDGGYSIAICNDQLNAVIDTYNLNFAACFYSDDDKKNFIINNIIGTILAGYTAGMEQTDPMFVKGIRLINRNILNYAAFLKDGSLEAEQEWRITAFYTWDAITGGPTDIAPDPLSLDTKSMQIDNAMVQYLEAPLLSGTADKVCINEVVIGPTPDVAGAKSACQALVDQSQDGGANTVISESVIPYKP
jgi:hypothetical protein